jgi:hypothetical protein
MFIITLIGIFSYYEEIFRPGKEVCNVKYFSLNLKSDPKEERKNNDINLASQKAL